MTGPRASACGPVISRVRTSMGHRSSSRHRSLILRSAVGLLCGLLLTLTGAATIAAADESGGSAVTWSVQPADETGPDGRSWVELTLDPGASSVEHLAVRNFSDHDVAFGLSAADGFFNENGRFNILPPDQTSTAAGTWISIADNVTVPAGGTEIVPFTITVPANAEPGDHAAGVAASIMSPSNAQDGSSIGVESRVGFRVMTRVTGELRPAASIGNVATSYRTSWNPFVPGVLTVDFDVDNIGNTRVRVAGTIAALGSEMTFPPQDEPQELLAGDTRHFSVQVTDVWPSVFVPTSVMVSPEVVVVGGEAPGLDPMRAETTALAVPWPQLIVILGAALILVSVVWQRGRSRRRLEMLLTDAREAGRISALDTEEAS